jgi:hypothetical protein
MNYYTEVLNKIQDLVNNNKQNKAYDLINHELSMPYVPRDYEVKFNQLKKEVEQMILNSDVDKIKKTHFDKLTIFTILKSEDNPLAPIALNQLRELNLNNSIEDINEIFKNSEIKNSIKVVILEYLVEQNININIEIITI